MVEPADELLSDGQPDRILRLQVSDPGLYDRQLLPRLSPFQRRLLQCIQPPEQSDVDVDRKHGYPLDPELGQRGANHTTGRASAVVVRWCFAYEKGSWPPSSWA